MNSGSATATNQIQLTVKRYSTARSGLLNAARIAASTSSAGYPISIILSIADCRADPIAETPVSTLNWI